MIISVASGKGGTGKTMIATNLAAVLGSDAQYLDCDVEEPNGHIFLKPEFIKDYDVTVKVPKVDPAKCNYCGECQDVCAFNAMLVLKDKKVLVFPELCHSCGACSLLCPTGAIEEEPRVIGKVECGVSGEVGFVHGRLNVGEPMAPPVIKEVMRNIDSDKVAVVDSAPGTSCPVVETVKDTDYCVLVTEPTPFGLNDLELAVEMLAKLKVPCGVVINRCDIGDDRVERFCSDRDIRVLMRIPHDMEIARVYSRGELIVNAMPEYRNSFDRLFSDIRAEIESWRAVG